MKVAILAVALCLSSCVATEYQQALQRQAAAYGAFRNLFPPVSTAAETEQQTTISSDQYRNATTVRGPIQYWHFVGLHNTLFGGFVCDRTTKGKTQQICFFELVADREDWAFLSSSFDSEGRELPFVERDREVKSGGVTEKIGLVFVPGYLAKHEKSGLDLSIRGKRGSYEIKVPAHYIAGFLKKAKEAQMSTP